MNLLFAASECAPFFKTGGLGDVMAALPKELKKYEHNDVRVVLPYYVQNIPEKYKRQIKDVLSFTVQVGWRNQHCGVKQLKQNGITYYFIDNLYYFDRPTLYDYDDDGERYAFFCQAVIEMLEKVDFIPDILHVNDWQTAMIPVLLKDKYNWVNNLRDIKTVLTIHNILFQGVYDQVVLSELFGIGYNVFHDRGLKYGENVSFLKGGIYYSDLVTTVSPTYAKEIQQPEFGYGLDKDLTHNRFKLVGILNGIDTELYNPERDEMIPHQFSINHLKNKEKNKVALQKRAGLPTDPDIALIGMVTRLDEQKGIQLVVSAMDELMKKRNIQFLLLGTGKSYFEKAFQHYNEEYPGKFKAIIDFDADLSQWIYAGADVFLMPSAFEPCGLSQLNSLNYGTLPLVHETGGLVDTVIPYHQETGEGTGFSFYDFDAQTMIDTIDRALTVYYDKPDSWVNMIKQGMKQDNSWKKSALEYMDQYKELTR